MDMLSMISLDTLDDVKRDFAKWRASRSNKTSKIPKHLWDKVFAMLDYHTVAELTKELGVSSSQISDKVAQRNASEARSKVTTDNFVEINLPSPMPGSATAGNASSRIEIRRPDGAMLTIAHLSQQTILQVLNQFTQAVQ